MALAVFVFAFLISIETKGSNYSKAISQCVQGLMVMSAIIATASIAYLVCINGCNCDEEEDPTGTGFAIVTLLSGISLVVMGAIINGVANKNDLPNKVKFYSMFVWGIGALLTLGASALLGYDIYQFVREAQDQKKLEENPDQQQQQQQQQQQYQKLPGFQGMQPPPGQKYRGRHVRR